MVKAPHGSRVCMGLVPLPPWRPAVKVQGEHGTWVILAQLLASDLHLHEIHSTQLSPRPHSTVSALHLLKGPSQGTAPPPPDLQEGVGPSKGKSPAKT